MSYEVRFEGPALVQLNGLPGVAFGALLERVVDLVDAPWDATVMFPGDDPAFRETILGTGSGILAFHVNDQAELIRIFNIVWIG